MNVSKWLAGALIGVIAATFTLDAEAQRRLGGGKNFGRQQPQVQQRQATPPAQQPAPPAQQAAPAPQSGAAATAPAAAAKGAAAGAAARSASPWRGALMGLAAGLGIAALASWLGFGEGLAMFLMFLLLGLVILLVVGFVMRRMRGPQPAYQGAANGGAPAGYEAAYPDQQRAERDGAAVPMQRSTLDTGATGVRPGSAMDEFMRGGAVNPQQPWGVPAGFDVDGFLGNAKSYFGKLQAAWDKGSLEDLQEFTTNEMFIALTHELRARGSGGAHTEVVTLEAALLGIDSSPREHVASVRFTGTLKVDGDIEQVDEVWNLAKPVDGSQGWLLAGIQQIA